MKYSKEWLTKQEFNDLRHNHLESTCLRADTHRQAMTYLKNSIEDLKKDNEKS